MGYFGRDDHPMIRALAGVRMNLDHREVSPNVEDRRGEHYVPPYAYTPETRYHPFHYPDLDPPSETDIHQGYDADLDTFVQSKLKGLK